MQAHQLPTYGGRIAVATRDFAQGELVHSTKAFVNIPTAAALRAGNVCIACYSMPPSTKGAPSRFFTTCDSCRVAVFCSEQCRAKSIAAHKVSGECAVIDVIMSKCKAPVGSDTDLLLTAAAVIARAKAEGYDEVLPRESSSAASTKRQVKAKAAAESNTAAPAAVTATEKQHRSASASSSDSSDGMFGCLEDAEANKEAEQAAAQREKARLEADIALVKSAPRQCIADLFPAVASVASVATSSNAAADGATYPVVIPQEVASSPTTGISVTSARSLSLPDAQMKLAAGIGNGHESSVAVAAILKTDADTRVQSLLAAPTPTFAEFCTLVTNVCISPPTTLHRFDQLRALYDAACSKATSSSFFVPKISHLFFRHILSTITCNCFGFFNTEDIQQGTGVFNSASLFNHSCVPNLLRRVHGKHEVFYAAREIKKGEELLISYAGRCDGLREQMLKAYRFWCECEICRNVSKDAVASGTGRCDKCFAKGDLRPLIVPQQQGNSSSVRECDVCFDIVVA